MKFPEIRKDEPLIVSIVNMLLAKGPVYMLADTGEGDRKVEICGIEATPNQDAFIVHYEFLMDGIYVSTNLVCITETKTVSKKNGEWWLHEVN